MKNRKIVIIGGGASGMMAAIVAARNGAQVFLLEKLNRVGKKILATGNGRCNLTNLNCKIDNYHGQAPKFVYGALGQFDVQQTIDFFEYLGIHCKVEEEGKVFPTSDQAASVLDILRYEMERLGVIQQCEVEVQHILPVQQGFEIRLGSGKALQAQKLIMATGGMASPQLGSDGSGYKLVTALGHSLVPPFPALVQLKLDAVFLKQLKGVKFIGQANLGVKDQVLRTEKGEILFTEYGISGPPILQLSRGASSQLASGESPWLTLDLFPQMTEAELYELLSLRFAYQPEKTLEFSLVGLLNKRLIPVLIKEAAMGSATKQVSSLTQDEIQRLIQLLKEWRLCVTGTQPWQHAQATAGGINVGEINPKTMESRLVKGLYLVGEMIDIDGDCGGYNLQWAWSSGYIAGEHASLEK